MDREILFRGFHPDENGTQEIWTDGTCNCEKVKGVIKGEWIEGYSFKSWDKCYILWGKTNDIPNMIEVIPETVGQFTGLTDKNGKKIFEGDIISLNGYRNVVVSFNAGCFGADDEVGFAPLLESLWGFGGKIIGTIFDKEGV